MVPGISVRQSGAIAESIDLIAVILATNASQRIKVYVVKTTIDIVDLPMKNGD